MKKFILGYLATDVEQPPAGELTLFKSKKKADFNCEEWCVVTANSLEEAKEKYEKTFEEWQQNEEIRLSKQATE